MAVIKEQSRFHACLAKSPEKTPEVVVTTVSVCQSVHIEG